VSARRGWFTIPEVFAALGYEPVKNDTWAAGNRARDAYEKATGSLPPKGLAPKTAGAGSHCFALYPAEWRSTVEQIVREVASQQRKQGSLF